MKLEDIGFHTLSDERARTASVDTDIWRAEIVLTDNCNFSCKYCRGMQSGCRGEMPPKKAVENIIILAAHNCRNIRFSGGEPTTYGGLNKLVSTARRLGIVGIALSTNGSATPEYYKHLISLGVNDFPISLDACCAGDGEMMTGGYRRWERVAANISALSKLTYVSVGVVLNEDNIEKARDIILFADELGVQDIRVIPSAQYGKVLPGLDLPQSVFASHPVLKYRVDSSRMGNPIRGLCRLDNHRCPLVLDDVAIAGKYQFPYIIYFREHGKPISEMGTDFRQARQQWYREHDCYSDNICKNNCLDVCRAYNNKHGDQI